MSFAYLVHSKSALRLAVWSKRFSARASSVRRVQLQTLHRYSFRKVARLHAAPADATGLDQQLQQELILWNVWQDCVDSQENHFWHGQKHVATTIHQ